MRASSGRKKAHDRESAKSRRHRTPKLLKPSPVPQTKRTGYISLLSSDDEDYGTEESIPEFSGGPHKKSVTIAKPGPYKNAPSPQHAKIKPLRPQGSILKRVRSSSEATVSVRPGGSVRRLDSAQPLRQQTPGNNEITRMPMPGYSMDIDSECDETQASRKKDELFSNLGLQRKIALLRQICPFLSAQDLHCLLLEKRGNYELVRAYVTKLADRYSRRQTSCSPSISSSRSPSIASSSPSRVENNTRGTSQPNVGNTHQPLPSIAHQLPSRVENNTRGTSQPNVGNTHQPLPSNTHLLPSTDASNSLNMKSEEDVKFDFDDPFFTYDNDAPDDLEEHSAFHRYQSSVKATTSRPGTKAKPKPRKTKSTSPKSKSTSPKSRKTKSTSVPKSKAQRRQPVQSSSLSPSPRPKKANIGKKRTEPIRQRSSSSSDSEDERNFVIPDDTHISDWSGSFEITDKSDASFGSSSDVGVAADSGVDSDSELESESESDEDEDLTEDLSINMENPWLIRNPSLEMGGKDGSY